LFRQGMTASVILLPVLALVVLLSVVQPAGVAQADPEAQVTIDLDPDDCSVEVAIGTGGVPLTNASADDCSTGDDADDFDSFGTGDSDEADANVFCLGPTVCTSLATAGALASGFGSEAESDAESDVTCAILATCLSGSGAASVSQDGAEAESESDSTISCGLGADCVSAAGALALAQGWDAKAESDAVSLIELCGLNAFCSSEARALTDVDGEEA
jgi:hypothetical protein